MKKVKSNLLEGIKLQLFADGGEGNQEPQDVNDQEPEQDTQLEQKEGKVFSQDDVNDIVAKRIAKEKAKFKEELEKEKEEAEKLAKLSESEKQKAIFDKQQREFEEERTKFRQEKLELEVIKQLTSKDLPIEFAHLLVSNDADSSFKNISKFEEQWKVSLEKAVNERLKGNTPNAGGKTTESKDSGLGARLAKQRSQANQVVENPYFK